MVKSSCLLKPPALILERLRNPMHLQKMMRMRSALPAGFSKSWHLHPKMKKKNKRQARKGASSHTRLQMASKFPAVMNGMTSIGRCRNRIRQVCC
jgi:hypothetical protein